MNDSCVAGGREPERRNISQKKRKRVRLCGHLGHGRVIVKPKRSRWGVRKTPPDMEAGANEEDGTFISISLADDPGRPREI